jgi:DNA invertase Pin-like site-specific DNA recombinase
VRIIGYERVSTARQGVSGLGIEAQRQAIEGYAGQRSAMIIARFTEVESGRNPDRPELGKALHLAKVTGATLVIAKLDRLSRNAAFLLTLRDSSTLRGRRPTVWNTCYSGSCMRGSSAATRLRDAGVMPSSVM